MPFSIVNETSGQTIKLEGAVTIRNAQEMAAYLKDALEDGAATAIDTQCLEDIDTCILQLLCSLRKTISPLSFVNPSAVFLGAVDRCGLRRELLAVREGL